MDRALMLRRAYEFSIPPASLFHLFALPSTSPHLRRASTCDCSSSLAHSCSNPGDSNDKYLTLRRSILHFLLLTLGRAAVSVTQTHTTSSWPRCLLPGCTWAIFLEMVSRLHRDVDLSLAQVACHMMSHQPVLNNPK